MAGESDRSDRIGGLPLTSPPMPVRISLVDAGPRTQKQRVLKYAIIKFSDAIVFGSTRAPRALAKRESGAPSILPPDRPHACGWFESVTDLAFSRR
jgi:hypothetical protein